MNLDEREDVQKKTFGKWINSQLAKVLNFVLNHDLQYPSVCKFFRMFGGKTQMIKQTPLSFLG